MFVLLIVIWLCAPNLVLAMHSLSVVLLILCWRSKYSSTCLVLVVSSNVLILSLLFHLVILILIRIFRLISLEINFGLFKFLNTNDTLVYLKLSYFF